MKKRKSTDIVGITLRVREKLRARIEAEANKNRTSLNAEIVLRLDKSLQGLQTGLVWRDVDRADFIARFGIEAYMTIPAEIREGAALK